MDSCTNENSINKYGTLFEPDKKTGSKEFHQFHSSQFHLHQSADRTQPTEKILNLRKEMNDWKLLGKSANVVLKKSSVNLDIDHSGNIFNNI